jgi:hypothetical protein
MIKKLLSIAFFALTVQAASAQCTPNSAYADSSFGVWPDTTENLPCAFADVATGYNAVIDIKTLTDTAVSVSLSGTNLDVIAYIEAFRINSVDGLPSGFTYIPNQSVWTNGGASPNFTAVQGCVSIIANQASIQSILAANPNGIDIPFTVVVDAKVANTNNPLANLLINNAWLSELSAVPGITAIPVPGYKIRVRNSAADGCLPLAVSEIIEPVSAKGNFPNPFNKSTTIQFNSDASKKVTLTVSNMIGKVVYTNTLQANKGENTFNFNADQLTPGIYFYTIGDGKNAVTRRMVIASN